MISEMLRNMLTIWHFRRTHSCAGVYSSSWLSECLWWQKTLTLSF